MYTAAAFTVKKVINIIDSLSASLDSSDAFLTPVAENTLAGSTYSKT